MRVCAYVLAAHAGANIGARESAEEDCLSVRTPESICDVEKKRFAKRITSGILIDRRASMQELRAVCGPCSATHYAAAVTHAAEYCCSFLRSSAFQAMNAALAICYLWKVHSLCTQP